MKIIDINAHNFEFFEGFLHPVVVQNGFWRANRILLGCVEDGVACGALCADYRVGYADVLSIAVSRPHRCFGAGKALLRALGDLLRGTSAAVCYASIPDSADAMDLMLLLESCGYSFVSESVVHSLPLGAAAEHASLLGKKSARKWVEHLLPLARLSESQWHEFCLFLAGLPHPACSGSARNGLLFEESFAYVLRGKVRGCILFSVQEDGSAALSLLYANAPNQIIPLLRVGLQSLSLRFPPETLLHTSPVTQRSQELFRTLLGELHFRSLPLLHYRKFIY